MSSTGPLDDGRYRRLRDLVDRAADLPESEWSAFLERECGPDPALLREALRLLEHGRAAGAERFLDYSTRPAETPSATVSGLAEPEHIGKFRIVRRFSEVSGQAAAYLAFDPDLERHVVLKRYHGGPEGLPGEAEEGRALARVVSPYVARCHGIERVGDAAYLVVEYAPGRNLAEVRRDGPIEPARIARILAQVAEGVAAVHACGLIHRDLKPANVILHDDGTPRLVDFGLAAHLASPRLRDLCGTPRYMAPEQARAESDRIDARTDVFGLGAVLYELLTGRPPHAGSTRAEVLEHAQRADVTPPRLLDPTIPAPLEAVCLKALAAAPENRYTTAQEFTAALRQAIEPDSGATRRLAWVRRGLPAAVVVLVLLALAVWFWRKGSQPVAGSLRAEIAVDHFRELGDGRQVIPRGPITADSLVSDPPRLRDLVRVRVELTRPAYVYLIALNPDGTDQPCIPAGDEAPAAPRRTLKFPEHPSDYFGLTDGVGLQAFVVVASDRPLPPYAAWKAQVPGGLAWSPEDREGLWTYDGSVLADASRLRGHLRGDLLRRESAPEALVRLCDRLRLAPGVTLVRAVAFPVKPDREIIK